MALDRSDVEKIAHLARLCLTDEEKDRYASDLSDILELVAAMRAVDTDAVSPMAHPLHMVQRLRPDAVTEPDRRAAYQAHAPQTQDGLYLVPRVVE